MRPVRRSTTLLLAVLLAAGCAGQSDEVPAGGARDMYESARRSMTVSNWGSAGTQLEQLVRRYPFGPYADQARLDLIYVYYRDDNRELAMDSAEQFIRENPRSPHVDYAHYMRGLIYFEAEDAFFDRLFRLDPSKRPAENAQRSYANFAAFLQRFPDSKYAADAHERMVWLRNHLAQYEYNTAEYYMRREAYLAAANRIHDLLANYPEATITPDALRMLGEAYRQLNLQDLARDTAHVYVESYGDSDPSTDDETELGDDTGVPPAVVGSD